MDLSRASSAEDEEPFDVLPAEALEALDAATAAIASAVSLDDVLQVITDRIRPLVGARYAALGIVRPDDRINRFITSGLDEQERRAIGAPPQGHGILGLLIRERRSIRLDDIMSDPRAHGFPSGHPPMHSFLGVPVVLANQPVGNLYLTEKLEAPRFTLTDQRLVETFARQAAMAIHTARLHDDLGRLALLQERERIGQDLHDGIIQALYGVGLFLEDVPELMDTDRPEAEARVDRAIDAIHQSIRDIRGFIFGLREDEAGESTLADGIRRLVEELERGSSATVLVRTVGDPRMDPADVAQVLRLTREALSNVARHAAATHVEVSLHAHDDRVELRIADDGRGFDTSAAPRPGHHGLGNMRARALELGATLD
ncbi:MAG: GAF domain-containing sensor histidine kinase, partial [Candidatus Limnocylindrales bacterium]